MCFDDLNRCSPELLGVLGQQIAALQRAARAGEPRIEFEGTSIPINPNFGVFATLIPTGASLGAGRVVGASCGRFALPDSLGALFRPVAVLAPEVATVAETLLLGAGFLGALALGAKLALALRLCAVVIAPPGGTRPASRVRANDRTLALAGAGRP